MPIGRSRAMPGLVAVGLFLLAALSAHSASAEVLRFGQTYGLGGSINSQSVNARLGIAAAFYECNVTNCLRGIDLELITLNDNYTKDGVLNYTGPQLLLRDNVTAIIGSMGSTPSITMRDMINQYNLPTPVIGPWSGSTALRSPFARNVVNIRTGYQDEAAAMVKWLTTGDNYYTRISALYQNDAFGLSGYNGLKAALAGQGLSLYSAGAYQANSVNITAAFNDIFSVVNPADKETRPQVICLFSLSKASIALMVAAKANESLYDPNTIWIAQSIVGPEQFYQDLVDEPAIKGNFTNIFAAQAHPSPHDTSSKLVRRYQAALDMYTSYLGTPANYTYNGLEGYLDGRFLIYLISRAGGVVNSTTILNAVWESETIVIDDQVLGPFIDSGAAACNQGAKRVYMSKLELNGTYSNVPEGFFTWHGCVSQASDVLAPILLGQSAALTGSSSLLGLPYTVGLKAAVARYNRNGGKESRLVKLVSLDDGYQATRSTINTKSLLKLNVAGLIGWSGSAVSQAALALSIPAKVPFFAPFSGAVQGLRKPCSKYAIHVRPSYYDETAAMIQYLWNVKGYRRISVFYQNDAFGISGLNGTILALAELGGEIVSQGNHERNINVTLEGVLNTTRGNPDAVVVFCIYFAAAQYVKMAMQQPNMANTVYIAPSVVNTDAYIDWLRYEGIDSKVTGKLWVTQVFPNPRDPSFPVVKEYWNELATQGLDLTPTYLGLEGYIAGRFITQALSLVNGIPTATSLTDVIYQFPIFDINGFKIGPFTLNTNNSVSTSSAAASDITECTCNQGGHQIYLTKLTWNATDNYVEIENDAELDYYFATCGINFVQDTVDEVGKPIRGIVLALSILSVVITVLAQIGVFVFRNTKTMTNSSPVFLSLVLCGAMFLSISPWFTMPWVQSSRFYTADEMSYNSAICMTWIWMLGIGFVLFFAPLVVKTWRVHRIFNNRVLSRIIVIKNSELALMVLGLLALEVVLLIVWTAISYQKFQKVRVPNTIDIVIYMCSGQHDTIFAGIQGGYFGALAFAGLVFAFLTRNIKYGSFKESQEIVLCVYLLTFVSIIIVPVAAALYINPTVSVVIRGIGVTFVTLTSIFVLFGMKFYRILTGKEKMSTASMSKMGTRSFNSTSGFGTTSSGGNTTTTNSSKSSNNTSSSFTSTDSTTDTDEQPKKGGKKRIQVSSKDSTTEADDVVVEMKPGKKASPAAPAAKPKANIKPDVDDDSTEASSEEAKPAKKSPAKKAATPKATASPNAAEKKKPAPKEDSTEESSSAEEEKPAPKKVASPKKDEAPKKAESSSGSDDDESSSSSSEEESSEAKPAKKSAKKSGSKKSSK